MFVFDLLYVQLSPEENDDATGKSKPSAGLSSQPQPQSRLTLLEPVPQSSSLFVLSFFSTLHDAPNRLTLNAQQAFAAIFPNIGPLEAEYLPFSKPKTMPKGTILPAVFAGQYLKDILDIIFALKIENGPNGPWRIPAMQHRHICAISESAAETLDALQAVISGNVSAMSDLMVAMQKMDEKMAEQIEETLEAANCGGGSDVERAVLDFEKSSKEERFSKSDEQGETCPAPLTMEVTLLIYLGLAVCQQIRILSRASIVAFLPGNEKALEMIDGVLAEEPAWNQHPEAEDVMARAMEGRQRSKESANGELEEDLKEVKIDS